LVHHLTSRLYRVNNKKQLLFLNNLSLEIKKKLIKSCIWSVALYRSETWNLGKNEERVINAFETRCWRRMLKIKWTHRITNDEVFQRAKEESVLLKILKNRCHSWIGYIIRHNKFVVNILEGAVSRQKATGRPQLQYLIKQVTRNKGRDSYRAIKRMACNNSRWKAANQAKDWRMIGEEQGEEEGGEEDDDDHYSHIYSTCASSIFL